MRFHKADIELFQSIAETEFRIRKPVILRVCKSVKLDSDYCVGLYEDEDDFHSIKISRAEIWNPVELFATIMHEYAHAWQSENGEDSLAHNTVNFRKFRKHFRAHYNIDLIGFNHVQ